MQSQEINPYIWEEDEVKQVLTALGATDISISERNVVTLIADRLQPPLDTLQADAIIPGALLNETLEVPEGQTLEPKLVQRQQGVFVVVFSDGEQQLFRTPAQQQIFSIYQAIRQIVLQLINGVTLGGVYAMIAVGYTLVYGILFMINFAHGEIFMFGSYGAFFLFSALTASGSLSVPWIFALILGFIVAMFTSAILAVIVERTAYRPLRQAPRLTLLISAIGASIFLQNVMMLLTAGRIKYYPDSVLVKGSIPIFGGVAIEKIGLMIIVISILMMIGLYTIIQKTKTGKAIRAAAEDKATAALMGINVNRIVVTTFLLGSSMAGAGGLMVGLRDTQINHMMGFLPGMKAFTAAVLGGIGNIPGAMFGGYFLGVAEALGAQFMPAEYKDVIAFTLLVLVLIFRPTGIMGEVLATKKM
ncbi:branched-chain amino acid ABC transporter permease [candidate division KSB3 bacterium]|uniref:Branched-chain amino acid ABC transporter permease n=1 Tax=candidate division KSB3 bacterium TaxID=2044937 RepID=A0A9D5JY65_9BACT|nr:branched-chain amino acid ABC transporter permease [candidate division KSB3 bacterium]MBD3326484.1 branched-chain amino acid ABC transporter permease [candidate division KSB3 bacterium]